MIESALERLQLEAPNASAAVVLASITILVEQWRPALNSVISCQLVQICPAMVKKVTKKSVVLTLKLLEVL